MSTSIVTNKDQRSKTPPERDPYPYEIPRPDAFAIDAVLDWISSRRGSRRPPEVSARFLVTIVDLHTRDQPFPPRKDIAIVLDTNPDSIDAAKNAALYNNEITEEVRNPPSKHLEKSSRVWTTRARYYVPCGELQDVVRLARRRAARKK
jgi:hypothetical protein